MALKSKASAVDQARIDAIAASISGTLSQFRLTNAELDDAKDATAQARAAQAESEGAHVNAREAIMGELARLSLAGGWTAPEIKLAASAAAKGNKVKADKAIETFMGEAKMAMDPAVRHQFATLMDIRDLAWDAEQDAIKIDKASPAPIKKAFQRKYHFLMAVLREVRSTGDAPDGVDDLVEWAKTMDPDLDAAKIKKRLDKIVEQLTAFNGDFPTADIEACIGFLNNITEKDLVQARNDKLGVAAPATPATPAPAPAPATVAVKPVPANVARKIEAQAALDEAASIAEGAASIDDLMDGFDGSASLGIAA